MRSLRHLSFALALVLAPVAVTVAQEPDPESPRYKAIFELVDLLDTTGDEAITAFVAERVDPALGADDGLVAELKEMQAVLGRSVFAGALAEGPNEARLLFQLPDGSGPEVTVEIAAEAPFRFTRIETFGLVDDGEPLGDEELATALQERLDELVAQDRFSGAVLVGRNGKPIFRKAYGLASKRFGVPNQPDTKFNLGSMNKMFTGVAICLLVEDGKLSFDDTVGKHLPDYPNKQVAEKVTIHHLLTHTSGLGSYWNEKWEERWASLRTVSDLLPLFADDPLAFEPGARFQYSNAGPIVLGLVIEATTGQSYYDYVRENVYAPSGMTDTDCYEMDVPVPNLAIGYTKGGDGHGGSADGAWRNNLFLHSVKGGPAGGGFSTVDDLLRFSTALQSHELLSPAMTETLITGKVEMGPGASYAYLFGDHADGPLHSYGHNGGAPGISAEFAFYPQTGHTIVVLSNYDEGAMAVARYARDLVRRQAPADAATMAEAGGDSSQAVGTWEMETTFQGEAIPATMTLGLESGQLVGSWSSMGREMELGDIELSDGLLRFTRRMGPGGPALRFEGRIEGDVIKGAYDAQGEELVCEGKRQ